MYYYYDYYYHYYYYYYYYYKLLVLFLCLIHVHTLNVHDDAYYQCSINYDILNMYVLNDDDLLIWCIFYNDIGGKNER